MKYELRNSRIFSVDDVTNYQATSRNFQHARKKITYK